MDLQHRNKKGIIAHHTHTLMQHCLTNKFSVDDFRYFHKSKKEWLFFLAIIKATIT